MDKNIFLKNSSGETLNPATSSLKVTAFSVSSLNNYTDLVVYLPHGLIEFNVYGKSRQDNVYSITIGLPDDTRKKLYAMFGEILRTGTGVAKNNSNSETYMFTYNLAIGSTSGTLLIKLNKPITILTTSTVTFTTNLNKFVTPSALGVLDETDTNDTQPVHIDGAGKLWTAPGGGTEVTIDPNGGLQNTSKGLSIKGDSTAKGGSGIVTGSTGTYSPISSDGKRGSIIGVRKTDQQTEAVGIGSDGILYTKPIGGTGDIEIDPAGGLEKGSAGYGLMLAANSGLNVDEDGLKIKPDTAGMGSGLYVSTAGIRVSQATNNTLGGIVGTDSKSSQTEAVGINSSGKLYTKPIPTYANTGGFVLYVDSVNGNDSNNGKTQEKAVATLQKAFELIPDFAFRVTINAKGSGTCPYAIPFHIEQLFINGNGTEPYEISDELFFLDTRCIYFSHVNFVTPNKTPIIVSTDCLVQLHNCNITQTYTDTTKGSDLSLIKVNGQISKLSVGIVGGSYDINCLAFAQPIIGHLEFTISTPSSASKIRIPLSKNVAGGTGMICLVTVPNPDSMINTTMPPIYASARQSYIVTGNNIELFSSDITINETMLTNVYQKTISGFTISNIVHEADLLLYGTTAKQLNFNWDGEVLGTGAIMKGNFQGLGTISFNNYIYNCVVRINTNGNVKLYSTFDSQVTIPSGTTVTILAKNINPGARL